MALTRKRKIQNDLNNNDSAAKKRKCVKLRESQLPKTRALVKKMNVNRKTVPSRRAVRKNKRPKKISTLEKHCNMKNGNPEGNNKDVVVLYAGKTNIEDCSESTFDSKINIFIASPSSSSNCDIGVRITDLMDDDHIIINEVLDMMEDYGIIETSEKTGAFDNIKTDLAATYEELKSSINEFFVKNSKNSKNEYKLTYD